MSVMDEKTMELVRRAHNFARVKGPIATNIHFVDGDRINLRDLLNDLSDALEAALEQARADEEAMRAALGSDQISNFEPLVERLAARKERESQDDVS